MALLRSTIIAAATAAALLAPAAASAATAHVGPGISRGYPPYFDSGAYDAVAYYTADRGQENRLLVAFSKSADGYVEVTFHDPAATIDPGHGCSAIDAHTAHCAAGQHIARAEAHLRDGDDEVHSTRPTPYPLGGVIAFGGPGNDLLDGGAGPDQLHGGGGRDTLLGGAYDDLLTDGDVSNRSGAAGPGPDMLDGGDSVLGDLVTYEQRTKRVAVNLPHDENAGERGEDDIVTSVEKAIGGRGNDRLRGDGGENQLYGRGGRDTLIGLGGDDLLVGAKGRDRLDAGDGDDTLHPGRGRDSSACGPGDDALEHPAAGEVIGFPCESVDWNDLIFGTLAFPPHPTKVTRHFAYFAIACPDLDIHDGEPHPCDGVLAVRKALGRHRLLGRTYFFSEAREPDGTFRVRLTKRAGRLMRRPGGVLATVSIRDGNFPSIAWTIRMRLKRLAT